MMAQKNMGFNFPGGKRFLDNSVLITIWIVLKDPIPQFRMLAASHRDGTEIAFYRIMEVLL
jgi:hypothetical protein